MKLILDQPIEELKEVEEVSKESMFDFPRPNEEKDWQRTSIFQTRVTCQGRLCTLIIDGGSCSNLASEELVEKLNLKTEDHPNPYQIAWVNNTYFGEFSLSSDV